MRLFMVYVNFALRWHLIKFAIKITLLILASFVLARAETIEYTDDDPKQYLIFSVDDGLCDTTVIDSLQLWVQINPDSGFSGRRMPFSDTIHTVTFEYIQRHWDDFGNLIPGHYVGEYWYYTIVFYNLGIGVLSPDTVHQTVDYWIIGGCLPAHEVDDEN